MKRLAGIFLILVLVFSAYLPALSGDFVWDDDVHITLNPDVTQKEGLVRIWTSERAVYYPLTSTVFWLMYRIWGENPIPFHFVNVLLHVANALLLWLLLTRLKISGAWLAATIFALHPIHVESVAWITELKNLIACFFFLLAAMSYLNFEEFLSPPRTRGSSGLWIPAFAGMTEKVRWHWMTLVFFALSLLSKPAAIMFPFLLLLYRWWKGREINQVFILRIIPFFLVSGIVAGWTVWEQTFHSGAHWHYSFLERILIAGRAFWFYLEKLIWPHPLSFIYSRWEIDSGSLISYLWPAAALTLFLGLCFFRSRGSREAFFALGCYLLMLFPVLGFFNVYFFRYSFVADHFQYLAAIGPIALISSLLWRFKRIGILILPVLWVLTFAGSGRFRNQESLWGATISASPSSWLAHNNLANLLMKKGKVAEAIQYYEEAVFYKPDFAEAHSNLGVALTHAGQFEHAIGHLNLALSYQPDFAEARGNLERAVSASKR